MSKFLLFCIPILAANLVFSQQIRMDFPKEHVGRTFKIPNKKKTPQVGLEAPAGFSSDLQWKSLRNGIDSCGVDTLEYLASKNTALEWYYLADTVYNTGGGQHDYYSRYAQYYDAPQAIDVHGASFYGYLFTAGDSAEVTVTLYSATVDSFPDQVISQTSIWVYDDFDNFDLNVMKQRVSFDSVITMTQPYLIALETSTTEQLLVLSNSYTNFDGAGEGLGFTYYSNPNFSSFNGWYDQIEFAANWDFDWIIEPAVKYHFDPSFSLDLDSICEGETVCVVNMTSDSAVRHRMYNPAAPLGALTYDWADGSFSAGVLNPCNVFTMEGTYYVQMTESTAWTATCNMVRTDSVMVVPQVSANFSFVDNLGGSITFSDLSTNADSIVWDLGDMSAPLSDSSFNYTYGQTGQSYTVTLIAYGACGSDTIQQVVLPDPTSVEQNFGQHISLYPNPNKGILHMSSNSQEAMHIELLNVLGEVIRQDSMTQRKTWSLENLSNGIYFVKFSQGNHTVTRRLVVSR